MGFPDSYSVMLLAVGLGILIGQGFKPSTARIIGWTVVGCAALVMAALEKTPFLQAWDVFIGVFSVLAALYSIYEAKKSKTSI